MRWLGEILAYAVFAALVGLLSVWPGYRLLPDDQAVVSLAFSHAAKRVGECRQVSQAELDKLPPNMRKPADCPRQRHPIRLQLEADGELLYQAELPPSGIWSDGKANVYERIQVLAGVRELRVAMNDSGGDGFDYETQRSVPIDAGRNVVIRFVDGDFQIR